MRDGILIVYSLYVVSRPHRAKIRVFENVKSGRRRQSVITGHKMPGCFPEWASDQSSEMVFGHLIRRLRGVTELKMGFPGGLRIRESRLV